MARQVNVVSCGALGLVLALVGAFGTLAWLVVRPNLPWGPADIPTPVILAAGTMWISVYVGVAFCLWSVIRRKNWKAGLAGLAVGVVWFAAFTMFA